MSGKLYNVGKIVNTHGTRGELKIVLQTDFPEERFEPGSRLLLIDPAQSTELPVVVEAGRPQKNVYLVRFSGLNDINLVEKYKGWSIKIREEDMGELEEGEYYHHQIVGCTVRTEEGEELGTVSEILTPGANDVWVVARPAGKPLLLPVIDDVVLSVDVQEKLITVRLMEGLLD
ncbi:ribosome maturation factor RimM [Paenibacillus sp. J31TS4]|uniref:ribosome maturation factor RimM n=1 Tax=Paenibacillus sp. J31TS4 TaxID=2807195 RepID=UPI001B0FE50C|nr:ribosome maturation factor RimM [Paenibacillus sp. J31TS4]GIP36785.1 ribosome maturation factor RimM [Paenibacillus sp. J31TS4]